jgi:hypothetical protein
MTCTRCARSRKRSRAPSVPVTDERILRKGNEESLKKKKRKRRRMVMIIRHRRPDGEEKANIVCACFTVNTARCVFGVGNVVRCQRRRNRHCTSPALHCTGHRPGRPAQESEAAAAAAAAAGAREAAARPPPRLHPSHDRVHWAVKPCTLGLAARSLTVTCAANCYHTPNQFSARCACRRCPKCPGPRDAHTRPGPGRPVQSCRGSHARVASPRPAGSCCSPVPPTPSPAAVPVASAPTCARAGNGRVQGSVATVPSSRRQRLPESPDEPTLTRRPRAARAHLPLTPERAARASRRVGIVGSPRRRLCPPPTER